MEVELTPSEEKLLNAIGETVNYSLSGRYSKQEIFKRLHQEDKNNPKVMRKIEKAFTKLRTKKLIQMNPSGEMTWKLTSNGLQYLLNKAKSIE
ncbi:MAG: hypothetical protein GPJ54_01825 [Candidatus Heimdallarchaeota archaeon]|nr:hypothetical protein [Candidatus Heimdallarchaeota archaeon]